MRLGSGWGGRRGKGEMRFGVVPVQQAIKLMHAPTAADLLNQPVVQQALDQAWTDSLSADPALRHEEGGWVYMNLMTGTVTVRRAPAGAQAALNLDTPPSVTCSP